MGCDIHAVMEYRHKIGEGDYGWWVNQGDPEITRNYEMFSVLAGVRNTYGLKPIANPKGFPEDNAASREARLLYRDELGDAHTASWLTLGELKEYDQTTEIFDPNYIMGRNPDGSVRSTCAGSSNPEYMKDQVGKRKVFSLWPTNPLNELIEKLGAIKERHGVSDEEVRIVFFFDN